MQLSKIIKIVILFFIYYQKENIDYFYEDCAETETDLKVIKCLSVFLTKCYQKDMQ